jgi:hypothetical protein
MHRVSRVFPGTEGNAFVDLSAGPVICSN